MYDYEIRDILRRATTPELWVDFRFKGRDRTIITFPPKGEVSYAIEINVTIGNKSQQPATYAVINLFIDEQFTIVHSGGLNRNSFTTSVRNHILNSFNKNWSVNTNLPIFSGIMFSVADGPVLATLSLSSHQVTDFYLGYEIHTAGFSTRKFIHIVQHPKGTLQIIGEIDM
jgi:hypothetical protein